MVELGLHEETKQGGSWARRAETQSLNSGNMGRV